VTILHGVTLGGSGRARFDPTYVDGDPEIGDRSEIMAGAAVLGPIRVGNGCFAGANAVLAHDLADGEIYTPARELARLQARVEQLAARVLGVTASVRRRRRSRARHG
jgi:serine acetyltransferase